MKFYEVHLENFLLSLSWLKRPVFDPRMIKVKSRGKKKKKGLRTCYWKRFNWLKSYLS